MAAIENKTVGQRFTVRETYVAGMELTGAEVKSLRAKQGSLKGSRVVVRGGEAFIVGMTIPPYQPANTAAGYDPEKPRRLLLSRKEIAELLDAESKKGLTIVPLEVYNSGRYLKARIAIVEGKNKADRREDLKRLDAKRETDRIVKRA